MKTNISETFHPIADAIRHCQQKLCQRNKYTASRIQQETVPFIKCVGIDKISFEIVGNIVFEHINLNILTCHISKLILIYNYGILKWFNSLFKIIHWDFPGSPVVETLLFHCKGAWVQILGGDLRSHMLQGAVKTIQRNQSLIKFLYPNTNLEEI